MLVLGIPIGSAFTSFHLLRVSGHHHDPEVLREAEDLPDRGLCPEHPQRDPHQQVEKVRDAARSPGLRHIRVKV